MSSSADVLLASAGGVRVAILTLKESIVLGTISERA